MKGRSKNLDAPGNSMRMMASDSRSDQDDSPSGVKKKRIERGERQERKKFSSYTL